MEKKNNEKQNNIYGRKNIISMLIAFPFAVVGIAIVKTFLSPTSNESLESILQATSSKLNKDLPKSINESTELTTTAVNGKEIIYKYTLKTNQNLTQDDLNSKKTINGVCTTPETRDLLERGAGMKYVYTDDEGKYVGTITVHLPNCNND